MSGEVAGVVERLEGSSSSPFISRQLHFLKYVLKNNSIFYAIAANSARKGEGGKVVLQTVMKNLIRTYLFYGLSLELYNMIKYLLGRGPLKSFLAAFLAYGVGSKIEERDQLINFLVIEGKDSLSALGTILSDKGIIPRFPGRYAFTFALSMGTLNYCYHNEPDTIQIIPNIIFKYGIGNTQTEDSWAQSLLQRYGINKSLSGPLIGALRNFLLSTVLFQLYGLRLLSGRSFTECVKEAWRTHLSTSLFLSLLSFTYRFLPRVIPKFKGVHFLIGFLSGFSMILSPSKFIATYLLPHTIFALFKNIEKRKIIYIPHFISIIYGIHAGIAVLATLRFGNTVPPGAKTFFSSLAGVI